VGIFIHLKNGSKNEPIRSLEMKNFLTELNQFILDGKATAY
jgi:hypothetical protein